MKLFGANKDYINLPGGHKVPIALVGVGVAVLTVFVIIRNRGGAAVGAPPSSTAAVSGAGAFGGSAGADFSGSISTLESQIAGLQGQVAALGQSTGSGAGAPPPLPGSTPPPAAPPPLGPTPSAWDHFGDAPAGFLPSTPYSWAWRSLDPSSPDNAYHFGAIPPGFITETAANSWAWARVGDIPAAQRPLIPQGPHQG